jgi:hypothetical protein
MATGAHTRHLDGQVQLESAYLGEERNSSEVRWGRPGKKRFVMVVESDATTHARYAKREQIQASDNTSLQA